MPSMMGSPSAMRALGTGALESRYNLSLDCVEAGYCFMIEVLSFDMISDKKVIQQVIQQMRTLLTVCVYAVLAGSSH